MLHERRCKFSSVSTELLQRQQSSAHASTSKAVDLDSRLSEGQRPLSSKVAIKRRKSEATNFIFEVSEGQQGRRKPDFVQLLTRNPVAAVALIPDPLVLFSAGALAGAIGMRLV